MKIPLATNTNMNTNGDKVVSRIRRPPQKIKQNRTWTKDTETQTLKPYISCINPLIEKSPIIEPEIEPLHQNAKTLPLIQANWSTPTFKLKI